MKSYVYNPTHFFIQHTLPGVFTLLIGLACLIRMVTTGFSGFLAIVLLVCVYNVWNEFVSASNPSRVDVDEDSITFTRNKKSHTYKIDDIKQFSMRFVSGNTTAYMNINKAGVLNGRYWLRVTEFNDEKELVDYIYDLDERVNKDSLVTKARREGRERLANKELIKQREQEYLDKKMAERKEKRMAKKEAKKKK